MSGIIEFRARRQGSGTVDTDLYDVVPVRDAFGTFASSARLKFFDGDGTADDNYPYGQRVEVEYTTDGGTTWNRRLAGLVVNTTRTTRGGLPELEVSLVAYDHLLRRRKVYKDYSSTTRSAILKDLIESFTSVTWNANNVSVVNDDSVDLPLRGKRVDEAISQMARNSAGEEWGVNDDLEFFFQEQDTNRGVSIGDADVIDYNLPEQGKRAINRFKLFYGANGGSFVEVEDRETQQDLKSKLSAARGVVISDSDTMTEVTTEARAEEIARSRLGERKVIQTGTVTLPLGRLGTNAGDVIEVTISDADISSVGFRVAQIDYNWLKGQTELTIAENSATDIDGLLRSISDSLANVRGRDADTGASGTRYLDFQAGVTMSTSSTVTTKTHVSDAFLLGQSTLGQDTLRGGYASTASISMESEKITKALLNMARDVWQGNSAPDLTHIGVGTDDAAATRADSALESAVKRFSIEKFGAGNAAEKFEFVGYIPAGGEVAEAADLKELMVFDASSGGNGYLRETFADTTIDASTELHVYIVVSIDTDSNEQGVITDKGQERLRDLVIGETGHEPATMLYGTGTTAETASDTSLGNQVHSDAIDSTADKETGITDIIERIGSGEANGNDISEVGYENSSNELLSHLVFEALSKTNSFELEANYRLKASNA